MINVPNLLNSSRTVVVVANRSPLGRNIVHFIIIFIIVLLTNVYSDRHNARVHNNIHTYETSSSSYIYIYIITPDRLLLVRVPAGFLIFIFFPLLPTDRQSCAQYAAAVRVIIYHIIILYFVSRCPPPPPPRRVIKHPIVAQLRRPLLLGISRAAVHCAQVDGARKIVYTAHMRIYSRERIVRTINEFRASITRR